MATNNLKMFYDTEIAYLEHELLNECEIADWRPEDFQMYALGVHIMASKVIEAIHGEGED